MNQQVDSKKVQALRKAVDAANNLYSDDKEWGVAPKALDGLQEHSGNFFKDDPKSLLIIKCIALNTLYNTRLRDNISIEIIPWAERLEEFIKTKGVSPSVEEVDELRRKPPEGARCAWVFIPKFFHFFGDKDKYPIIDSFACIAVGIILNKTVRAEGSYIEYTKDIKEIAKMASADDKPVEFRKLDRFLWLAGHYWELKRLEKKKPNELEKPRWQNWKALFNGEANDLEQYLNSLTEESL